MSLTPVPNGEEKLSPEAPPQMFLFAFNQVRDTINSPVSYQRGISPKLILKLLCGFKKTNCKINGSRFSFFTRGHQKSGRRQNFL